MSKAAAHLRLVDTNTGEVVDASTPEEENRALRLALARLQRSYDALIADKARERKEYAHRADIEDAFRDWQEKMVAAGYKGKGRCKLGDARFDAVKSILEAGYTLKDLKAANTGIARYPYEVYGRRCESGAESSLYLDLGRVCEKEWRFEECARLGYLVEKAREEAA